MLVPANVLKAQERKGYVGMSMGAAFMTGELKDVFQPVGAQFTINFGYLFTHHVGIHASIFGTTFIYKLNTSNDLGLSGSLVGPLLSTATETGKLEFDLRPGIGFAGGSGTVDNKSTNTNSVALALGLGGSLRWNCWSRVSFVFNLDYYHAKPKDDSPERYVMDLSSFGISAGANFRF